MDEYTQGAQYVLRYLSEIFEDVKDTDLWTDFGMEEGDN